MLWGIFRTKEKKISAVILCIILTITGSLFINQYINKRNYEEQAVMANEYLRDGDFEQAINAYVKAISMKSSDEEALTIGLSEAYIGIGNYDKALEVLRSCYQKTSGVHIKEKIEEVSLRKTDHEYSQIILRADKYYVNGEYDKAISEYQKAKLIKSKEITSYQRIAEAYIKKDNYLSARNEVMDGLEFTHSDELYELLGKINHYLIQQSYNDTVKEADEYIYQENYEDGIEKYREAILIMPKNQKAYLNLAKAYLSLEQYEDAIVLINEAFIQCSSDELKSLLDKATTLKAVQDKRKQLLSDLYSAFDPLNKKSVMRLMKLPFFEKNIAVKSPLYYNTSGEVNTKTGKVMLIYNKNIIYYGSLKDGMKKGIGIYFMLTNNKTGQGFYYYQGEWSNDIPEGKGIVEEYNIYVDKNGKQYNIRTVTEGNFRKGYENGAMRKSFYRSGKASKTIQYNASEGVPQPMMDENNQPMMSEDGLYYSIAEIKRGKVLAGEYYTVHQKTIWGVKPWID